MAGRSRVLVAYATKMGSTKEIAEVIGQGARGCWAASHRCELRRGPRSGRFRRCDHRQCAIYPALGQDGDPLPEKTCTRA